VEQSIAFTGSGSEEKTNQGIPEGIPLSVFTRKMYGPKRSDKSAAVPKNERTGGNNGVV